MITFYDKSLNNGTNYIKNNVILNLYFMLKWFSLNTI